MTRIKSTEDNQEDGEQLFSDYSLGTENESPSLPVVYTAKISLELATPDDTNIVKKSLEDYVAEFKTKLVKTALSTLEMCRVVYEAKRSLDYDFRNFCRGVGLMPDSSTTRKYLAIGKVYPRLIEHVDQLPASWTNIYLITQIPSDDFELLVNDGRSLSSVTGADLNELILSTRNLDSLAEPLPVDKKTGTFVFGKLMFTKKPDDTDWRAMRKALAEVEARLPIRFAVNNEAQYLWEQRKLSRYEQNKTKYEEIEFKPEQWDLGRDANTMALAGEEKQEQANNQKLKPPSN
jgi:hypothetical protein